MKEIKVALAGCGGVAKRYRRSYLGIAGARVVTVIDANSEVALEAAKELSGGEAHIGNPAATVMASTDFADALRSEVDVVVISTPNHLHCEQAVAALEAGKHVLLQKPMARTVAECEEILKARDAAGVRLGLYMNLLDQPLYRDLKRLVFEGYLGNVATFSARLAHRGGLGWGKTKENWRSSRERTGGGSFIQLGVHYQHLMRWLLDQHVLRVQAMGTSFACHQLEGDDLMMAQYLLSGRGLGEIQTSWCCEEEHVSLLGTKGSFHYRDNRRVEFFSDMGPFEGEVLRFAGHGKLEVIESLTPPEWDDASNPYNQHRRFIEAIAAGQAPEVSGEEGLEDVRLVEECYRQVEGASK